MKERKERPYKIILLDLEMPMMDGFRAYELLREYWEESKMECIPTYALTAHQDEHIAEKVRARGMDGMSTRMNS